MFYDWKEYIQMLEITPLELATRMSHRCLAERALGEEQDTGISGGGNHARDDGIHSSWGSPSVDRSREGSNKKWNKLTSFQKLVHLLSWEDYKIH